MASRIDRYLEVEASLGKQSEVLLKDLGKYSLETFELIAEAFEAAATTLNASSVDAEVTDRAKAKLAELDQDDLPRLNRFINDQNTRVNGVLRSAAEAWMAMWARYAQKIAFQHIYRQFRWGATDIRRLRITSAWGRARNQVEALAYAELFSTRPRQALHWLDPNYDQEALFRSLLPKTKNILHRYNLAMAYSYGSGLGAHATFAAAASSTTFKPTVSALRVNMADEDFDLNDPFTFHNMVTYFLRIQQRVLDALPSTFTDLETADHEVRRALIRTAVDDVYWVLSRRYADRVTDLQTLSPRESAARRSQKTEAVELIKRRDSE
jgi:site-specific DNA-adenine methylase